MADSQNDMKLVDVNCGRLVPQGNLNPNTPGSFAYLRNELDKKQGSKMTFHSGTSYGFKPGYTTKGLNNVEWGSATF